MLAGLLSGGFTVLRNPTTINVLVVLGFSADGARTAQWHWRRWCNYSSFLRRRYRSKHRVHARTTDQVYLVNRIVEGGLHRTLDPRYYEYDGDAVRRKPVPQSRHNYE